MFVGNLDLTINDNELKSYFNSHKLYPDKVYIPLKEGKSRGFGFVTFSSQQ